MTRKSEPLSGVFAGGGKLTTGENKAIKGDIWRRKKAGHLDLHGRPVPAVKKEEEVGGRPRNFDDDATKTELMAKLEPCILKRQAELGRPPYRKDDKVLRTARGLVQDKGLESSDDIIIKQLIIPVLRKFKPKRRR
jgi:hypothetical protein